MQHLPGSNGILIRTLVGGLLADGSGVGPVKFLLWTSGLFPIPNLVNTCFPAFFFLRNQGHLTHSIISVQVFLDAVGQWITFAIPALRPGDSVVSRRCIICTHRPHDMHGVAVGAATIIASGRVVIFWKAAP